MTGRKWSDIAKYPKWPLCGHRDVNSQWAYARRPRTGRERGPPWRPSEASYLTVWTLNDRFFASPVFCMLRRVLSENWRKETEKWFWWGGRFGRVAALSGRAEKETRGSWPTTGCLPVDRNQLGPDSWRDKKGVSYWTDRHTHRDTHTHGMKSAPLALVGY